MEKSNKRGKIPQSDWPLIMARYEAGETLASIARTYDCSPPAISYVVSKSRARQPARDKFRHGSERDGIAADQGNRERARESQFRQAVAPRRSDRTHAEPAGRHGTARRGNVDRTRYRRRACAAAARQRARPSNDPRDEWAASRRLGRTRPAPVARARRIRRQPETGGPSPVGTGQRPTAPSPLLRGEADTRHRLHLSLGNGAASHNGSGEPEIPVIGPVRRRRQPARSGAHRPACPIRRRAGRRRPDFPRPDRVPCHRSARTERGRVRRRLPQGRHRRVYRS